MYIAQCHGKGSKKEKMKNQLKVVYRKKEANDKRSSILFSLKTLLSSRKSVIFKINFFLPLIWAFV